MTDEDFAACIAAGISIIRVREIMAAAAAASLMITTVLGQRHSKLEFELANLGRLQRAGDEPEPVIAALQDLDSTIEILLGVQRASALFYD